MSEPTFTPEVVERLLDRISEASVRISKDIETQAALIDKRIKVLVDQGEKITRRLVETIDKDLRAQLKSLRTELEQLARRLVELRAQAQKRAVVPTPVIKPVTKPVAKTTAKKMPAKKAPAKKMPVAKKTPAKKLPAKKSVRALAA